MADEDDRSRQVKDYVVRRLRAEVARGARGTRAEIARRFKMSTAHVSNTLSANAARRPGELFCRKAAAYWGMSYAELERVACGDAHAATDASLQDAIRSVLREEQARREEPEPVAAPARRAKTLK